MSKNFLLRGIGLASLLLAGCQMTRSIDENYLVIARVEEGISDDRPEVVTLRIRGDYAESAWGMKDIEAEVVGDVIVLSGKVNFEGEGAFCYALDVPENINTVRFYNRIIWSRHE